MLLPADHDQWLEVSQDQLIARRCAYWLGLHEAPTSTNETNQTVYIPKINVLTPDSLRQIAEKLACQEGLTYVAY